MWEGVAIGCCNKKNFAYVYQKVGGGGWNNILLPVALHVRPCEGGLGHNCERFTAIPGKHKKVTISSIQLSGCFKAGSDR